MTNTKNIIKMWEHDGWGNSIYFLFPRPIDKISRITGHLKQKPRIGDEVLTEMQDGKIGSYEVIKVRYPGNPPDQFFCDVKFLKYIENIDNDGEK